MDATLKTALADLKLPIEENKREANGSVPLDSEQNGELMEDSSVRQYNKSENIRVND